MSEAKVDLTVQDNGATSAWQRYQNALADVLETDRQRSKEDKAAAQAAAELGRIKSRVLADIETAEEKAQKRMKELDRLRQAEMLTEKQYARAVAQTKEQLQESGKVGATTLGSMAVKLLGVAGSYVSIGAAVATVISSNKELLEQANELGNKYDEMFRKIRVQGGLNELQGEQAKTKILDLADKNAVDEDIAANVSRQLISSGFSVEDSTGPAADVMIKAINAGNLQSEDPTQLAQAFGQFLAAQGVDKNAANLKKVAVGTQRLFEGTDMQVADMSDLAGKSEGVAGRMSWDQVTATYNVMRQKTGKDKASTAFKIFTDRLMGAKGDKGREKVLKEMKLKPEDVDFLGESPQEVLDKLAKGMDQIKPERRSGALQALFGTEASSPIEGLIRNRADVQKYVDLQKDEAGFEKAARIGSTGRAAGKRRSAVENRRVNAEFDDEGDTYRESLDTEMLRGGYTGFQRSMAFGGFDTMRFLGASPETAVRNVLLPTDTSKQALIDRTLRSVETKRDPEAARDRDLAELKEALTENTKATRENSAKPAPAGRPNVAPTAKRPSQSLVEAN